MTLKLGNDRGWKSFEEHARESLDGPEGWLIEITDVKADSGEGSERKEDSQKESFHCLREYIYHHEQNSG